jgi:predicted RNA-binding protein with PUA-like domain
VDIEFVEKLGRIVPLAEIREHPRLRELTLLKRSRLSVQPVGATELQLIRELADR